MARSVEAAFNELLDSQRLTSAQVEVADTRINALQEFFENNFTMAEDAFKTGSYARGTICSGQKDVDLMAPLDYPTYKDRYDNDSRAFLYYVRDELNDRYWATKVSARQVAVTLDFTSIAADVVPCFKRTGGGFLMPDGNRGWMATNPRYHAQLIANGDEAHNGRLKPLIRLIKAWNLVNGNHLRSFHVELLVYNMWNGNNIGISQSHNVRSTLGVMSSWVNSSCEDPWNPPTRIDDYLSAQEKGTVIRMLQQDAVAAAKAEEYREAGKIEQAFERWNSIYRSTFPAFG